MHDIDRTQMEYNPEMEWMPEAFEYGEAEWSGETAESGVFNEAEEMELAAELLGVASEQELDQFLGRLMRRAGRAVGRFVPPPTHRALGGILKGAAKQALPDVASMLGRRPAGGQGATNGGHPASPAGELFGLELEGLSLEDQEFEVAKRLVRLAGVAVKNAALSPTNASPNTAAQAAAVSAAQQHAPGLLAPSAASASSSATANAGSNQSGRWVRRGNTITLFGA
jgi:hypothetical protein